jgi:hypothetical protein
MRIATRELGNAYAFLDPSGGNNQVIKRITARSAIVVVQEGPNSSLFVMDAWAAKCSTDTLTNKIFEVNRFYKPRLFGIESNAMQSLYVESVTREARDKQIPINLIPWHQPTHVKKAFRIRTTLQPWFAHGKMIIRDTLLELKNELVAFPTGTLMDLVDALASAVAMVPPRTELNTIDTELVSLANYMRLAGYGQAAIERRLMELRSQRATVGFNAARYLRERGTHNYGV